MNDNIYSPNGCDIYVTIDNENRVIDICKSNNGTEGFRAFIDRNIKRVINKGVMPNA